jgi:TP901 family phage tail tape measure protein
MADKFGITAELLLVLDSNIESTVDQLKNRLNKKPAVLRLDLEQGNIKNIYKEVKFIQKGLDGRPLKLRLKVAEEGVKEVYKEINFLKKSIYTTPLKLRLEVNQDAIKEAYKEITFFKRSVENSPVKISLNVSGQPEIKNAYKEINSLKTNTSSPLKIVIDKINDQELVNISNLIKGLRSKNLSIGLNLKKNTLDNFQKLSIAVGSLNTQVSGFNLNQFDGIAQRVSTIARSISSLNKINGKKITFDLSLKDIKNVDKLESGLNKVAVSFTKATTSGTSFNNVIKSIATSISALQSGLSTLNVSSVSAAAKAVKTLSSKSAINAQNSLTSAIGSSRDALYDLGLQSGITLKRFGAYTLVTAGFFRLSFAIRNAVDEFIGFDKQLTRIRQVTGQSVENTKALGDEVGRLAIKYGVSSSSILETSQVLAQAGFSTGQVKEALEALTKTEIAATFDSIENTVEGAISAMAQFNIKTSELEETLGSINAVSAAFAVESSDITTAIQKAGGAFASAGGSLNELIGLFTTVRSTTRESADTVAVGIRTITTRLQRLSTSKFLEDFGINIRRTAEEVKQFQDEFGRTPDFKAGDFVGAFEALRRISEETAKIGGQDPRIAQIAEELAGFRQINKIIPLLRSFEISQNAIQVALAGTDSLTKDAAIAQESYANQLTKVREEFQLMIREFGQDESIKAFIKDILDLTKVTIKLAATLKDLLIPLGILGAIKIGKSSGVFFQGFKDSFLARKDGGYIPGIGNKDSELIAAMPGEYVIKKSSAKKLGPTRLNMLNQGVIPKFAAGGLVGKAGAAVAGAAVFSSFGGFKLFEDLDDKTKETAIGLGGLALQIGFVIGSIKSFSTELGTARKVASKFTSRPTDPKLVSDLNTRRVLNNNFTSGYNFLQTRGNKNSDNIQNAKNALKQSRNQDYNSTTGLLNTREIREETRKRILSFGGSSQDYAKRIQNIDKKIVKAKTSYVKELNESISREKVDPRSFAGKQGLTEQFRVKDSQTGTFRNFNTRKEAFNFARKRNPSERGDALLSLQQDRASNVSKFNNLSRQERVFRVLDNSVQRSKAKLPGPDIKSAGLLGKFEGRQELVNQAGITSRIQDKIVSDQLNNRLFNRGKAGGVGASRSILNTINSSSRSLGKFATSNAGLGVGAAVGIGGAFAGSLVQRSAQPTDTSNGSRGNFALGGALSQASSGAAIGATIGTLIAPGVGTAIGAALGGVSGAVYGTVNSLKEFDNQLADVNSKKSIKELGRIFDSIKDGTTTSATSSFGVTSNIRSLQTNLQSTSDPSIRQNILGELENQKVNISNFIGDISKLSSSYDNFTQRVDIGTQRLIAGIIGIPFSEFEDNIKRDIESANKLDNAFKAGVETIRNFDNSVRSILRFSEAFSVASQRVNVFTENLKSFASGSSGSTVLTNNLSSGLANVENGISTRGLEKQVLDFTGQFGQAGQVLGKTAADIIKVSNILPDILSNLRSGSALDDTGAVTERFAAALGKSGVGKEVSNLIIQRIEDLLGADNKDPEFFKNLSKDPLKALSTLLEGTKPALDAISSAYETSTNKLNEFASSLENLRGFDKTILDGITKVAQNRSSLIQARGTFTGQNVDAQLLANERNVTRINTGGASVNQLQTSVNQRKQNIQGLTSQLNNTEDIQARARIQVALENERSALERTTSALSYLANTTNELSILQQQLNRAQSERLSKRDFALDFASGSIEDRVRSQRIVSGVNKAANSGTLSGTSQELRKDVISFLKTFSESLIGDSGKTGNQVLNEIANNATGLPIGFRNTGTPTKQENSIQAQIEASLNTQKEAQQAINNALISDRQQFSQQLNKDMQTFFADLRNILAEGQTRDLRNQIGSTSSKLEETRQRRDSLGNIQSRFGQNALVNAASIKSVNEDITKFTSTPGKISSISERLGSERNLALRENRTTSNILLPGSDVRSSVEDFDKRAGSLVQNLSPDQIDRVRQNLQTGDIGRDFSDNTISVKKAFAVLEQTINQIGSEASGKLLYANEKRENLVSQVGGAKNFAAISKDVTSKDSVLLKSLNDFPKDASISGLNSEITNLTGQLLELNNSFRNSNTRPLIRRNSGGIVPGSGNTDSVPALLTPGEFVLSKPVVKKIGVQTLKRTNSGAKRFNSGGLVQNTTIIDAEVVSKFNLAVNQLGVQINNMRDAISKIPTEIVMNGTHRLDVYINGAQAFNQMKPELASLIQSEIKNSINKLIKTKMPNLGNFEG